MSRNNNSRRLNREREARSKDLPREHDGRKEFERGVGLWSFGVDTIRSAHGCIILDLGVFN